jgi:hypothetical protein
MSVKAELHRAEEFRVGALRRYGILDTPREADFDEVVQVASAVCGTPISVINLIDQDRQWFKAEVGLGVRETPLDSSICAHAILQPGLFIVPDTTLDRRFADNPLVTGARIFAFMPARCCKHPKAFRSAPSACSITSLASLMIPKRLFCASWPTR